MRDFLFNINFKGQINKIENDSNQVYSSSNTKELEELFTEDYLNNLKGEEKEFYTFLLEDLIAPATYYKRDKIDTIISNYGSVPIHLANMPEVEIGDYIIIITGSITSLTVYYKLFKSLEDLNNYLDSIKKILNISLLDKYINAHKKYYDITYNELNNGLKNSHWMWFIFPQIKGLGYSRNNNYYAFKSIEEAKEYYNNDYLRNHLIDLTRIIIDLNVNDIKDLLKYPDYLKLNSCMTLFYNATGNEIFKELIDKYYDGKQDMETLKLIR